MFILRVTFNKQFTTGAGGTPLTASKVILRGAALGYVSGNNSFAVKEETRKLKTTYSSIVCVVSVSGFSFFSLPIELLRY